MVLVVRRANYILMPSLLASGEISVGVSYTDELPANAKRKVLRRPRPMLLRADTIPGPLSMEDYCARPHAMVSFAGDLNGYIDEELALHGCKRKVVLAVPQFNGLSSLLAGTDIIATVPDYAATAPRRDGRGTRRAVAFETSQDSNSPWPGAAPRTTTPPSAGCARASRCSSRSGQPVVAARAHRHRAFPFSLREKMVRRAG